MEEQQTQPIPEITPKHSQAWGIAGLTMSILSIILFLMPYFGIFFAIFALIASGIQEKNHGGNIYKVATLVLGIIGILLNVLMGIFAIIAIAMLGL